MNKQAFRQLLKRYLENTATEKEKQLVDFWFESLDLEQEKNAKQSDWELLENRLWDKIQLTTNEALPLKVIPLWQNKKFQTSIAASILFLVGCFIYFFNSQSANDSFFAQHAEGNRIEENTSEKIRQIRLEDGTLVKLYPKAKLTYPAHFSAEKREVSLVGNAFFEVAHNAQKPFFVLANEVVTKVLGTSFYIKAGKNAKVEVEVKTGKVSVSERKPTDIKNNGVILTPNQKVVYYTDDKHFVTGLVDKPELLASEKNLVSFDFKDTELKEVIEKLEKSYGIDIILENENIGNCNLTGNLDGMSMFEQMDVLSHSLGTTYQIKGTTILISGTGCEK
ncbi:MAG: FecR family protein [Cytophagales bacterium]|nr:MAG: FecR family protein [Cytophagales bacterium]